MIISNLFFDNSLQPVNQVFLADYNGKLMYDWIPCIEKIYSYFKITGFFANAR